MTNADIAERIQAETGYTKKESAEMMEAVFSIMKATLESGETLKISGFGSFVVKQKKDRRGRNPQTGEAIIIEARSILTFKPSTLLRQTIAGSTYSMTAVSPSLVMVTSSSLAITGFFSLFF